MNTWSQVRYGRAIQARCDYILVIYWLCLEMVVIRGVRNYPSGHFSLPVRLIICPTEAGHKCRAYGI